MGADFSDLRLLLRQAALGPAHATPVGLYISFDTDQRPRIGTETFCVECCARFIFELKDRLAGNDYCPSCRPQLTHYPATGRPPPPPTPTPSAGRPVKC